MVRQAAQVWLSQAKDAQVDCRRSEVASWLLPLLHPARLARQTPPTIQASLSTGRGDIVQEVYSTR